MVTGDGIRPPQVATSRYGEVSLADPYPFPTMLFRFENCGLLSFVAFHFWDKSQ